MMMNTGPRHSKPRNELEGKFDEVANGVGCEF